MQPAPGAPWYKQAWKVGVAAGSAGSAIVSVVSALYSYGVIGHARSHETIANIGAAWVGLRPAVDTATALGDTLHFAATVTDANGSVLIGAHPTWVTDNPLVAVVRPNGAVLSRGPGTTTITAVVGTLVARARVVVVQRVASVRVEALPGDSIALPENGVLDLHALPFDARGHLVGGLSATWHIDDTAVARVDSGGVLTGMRAGRAVVTARVEGRVAHALITVVPTPATLTLDAGADQHALAGTALPRPVVVRVTSRTGHAVADAPVVFRTIDGQGAVHPDTVRTDGDGRARASWTLGPLPGRQTLLAGVVHVDSTLAIVAESDPVARDTRVSAMDAHPAGTAGEPLTEEMTVRVTDTTGRALADVPVTWSVLDGGAVHALGARTDSLGEASARWTLGGRAGRQRLRAQVGAGARGYGIAPVTISAAARPGRARTIALVSGDRQHATVGDPLHREIVVHVEDALGNRVPDATLAVRPSDGSVPDSAPCTDAHGVARIRWTMGHRVGRHHLVVRVEGVRHGIEVRADARPGAPAQLSLDESGRRHGSRRRLVGRVTDEYGNPVPHARVSLSAPHGRVSWRHAYTDDAGRIHVEWTPGRHPAEQTLHASVGGTDARAEYVVKQAAKTSHATRTSRHASAPHADARKVGRRERHAAAVSGVGRFR